MQRFSWPASGRARFCLPQGRCFSTIFLYILPATCERHHAAITFLLDTKMKNGNDIIKHYISPSQHTRLCDEMRRYFRLSRGLSDALLACMSQEWAQWASTQSLKSVSHARLRKYIIIEMPMMHVDAFSYHWFEGAQKFLRCSSRDNI